MIAFFRRVASTAVPLAITIASPLAGGQMSARQDISFELQGLQIASIEDKTGSTGATLFYFPNGGTAQADVRGGSAATSELTLFDEGSYSAWVDGVVFAGGSTMGLAAGDGVREMLFKQRSAQGVTFDSIPSVPTAVVYDYGGRVKGKDQAVYPDRNLGVQLMNKLSDRTFTAGRAGAGVSTTSNKVSKKIWGGQGLAVKNVGYGKVLAAVVLNPGGDVNVPGLKPIDASLLMAPTPLRAGTNTTLSIVVTDIKLSRNELKRLAVMVHTSMARMIHPFHSSYDGDTHLAVSTNRVTPPNQDKDVLMEVAMAGAEAMKDAIELAAKTANSAN